MGRSSNILYSLQEQIRYWMRFYWIKHGGYEKEKGRKNLGELNQYHFSLSLFLSFHHYLSVYLSWVLYSSNTPVMQKYYFFLRARACSATQVAYCFILWKLNNACEWWRQSIVANHRLRKDVFNILNDCFIWHISGKIHKALVFRPSFYVQHGALDYFSIVFSLKLKNRITLSSGIDYH